MGIRPSTRWKILMPRPLREFPKPLVSPRPIPPSLIAEPHNYRVPPSQKLFSTTLKNIIPLPEPTAPSNSPSHPNAYGELPIRSRVAAIYPDTSSFYWGTVLPPPNAAEFTRKGRYLILFDEDEGRQTEMPSDLILDVSRWLGGGNRSRYHHALTTIPSPSP